MDRARYRGIFVIMTTPFTDELAVDEAALERTVEFCLAADVHGVVCNAIASEGAYLGEAERRRSAEIVIGAVAGQVPVIVSVSASHYLTSVTHALHAQRLGADAIMSLPPSPAMPTDIMAHYRAIGAATDLPLVIQNFAGPGVSAMSAAQIADIVTEVPTARFVKEESAYPARTAAEIIRLCGDRIDGVMGGRAGKTMMEEVRHGVVGTMPACEVADVHVALWAAIEARDMERAREIFARLLPLLDLEASYGAVLMKEVLRMRGVIPNAEVRQGGLLPLDRVAREEAASILDGLADLMLPAYPHWR